MKSLFLIQIIYITSQIGCTEKTSNLKEINELAIYSTLDFRGPQEVIKFYSNDSFWCAKSPFLNSSSSIFSSGKWFIKNDSLFLKYEYTSQYATQYKITKDSLLLGNKVQLVKGWGNLNNN